jgi:hypothetical protein
MWFYNFLTKTVRKSKQKHTEFNFHCISVKVLNVTGVKRAIWVYNSIPTSIICILFPFYWFFLNFFNSLSPLTTWSIRYLCGRLVFLFFLMWCGGAPGYFPRPPTPTLSSPFSFFWTTQHEYNNTQHPWEAHPAWDSNPADLAVVSEE